MELWIPLEDRLRADSIDKLAQVEVDQPDGHSKRVDADRASNQPCGFVLHSSRLDLLLLTLMQRGCNVDDGELENTKGRLEGIELDLAASDRDEDRCED